METQSIAFDRGEARALYREYKKHLHWSAPIDRECMRAYQLIAQGRAVIRALESVKAAGVYTAGESVGLPKLGLCRADATACFCAMSHDGSATMTADDSRVRISWGRGRVPSGTILNSRSILAWPAGSFPYNQRRPHVAPAVARAARSPASAAEARPPELPRPLGGAVGQGPARRPHAFAPHRQGRSVAGRRLVEPDRHRTSRPGDARLTQENGRSRCGRGPNAARTGAT